MTNEGRFNRLAKEHEETADRALCETTLKLEELGIEDNEKNRERVFEVATTFLVSFLDGDNCPYCGTHTDPGQAFDCCV